MYLRRFFGFLGAVLALSGCSSHVADYCCKRDFHAYFDLEDLYDHMPCIDHPLGLEEILEIALEYNLDVRLQELEQAAQCEAIAAERLKQLGRFNVYGELKNRNRNTGSSSDSLTDRPPAPPSYSSEQDTKRADLTYVWSALDFGLSYYQTRQETNGALILKQRHLRARQNLILDVYRAYYRAVVARRAMSKSEDLITSLRERLTHVERQVQERTVSEMRGLLQKDRIIDVEIRLYAFENEYRSAMAELQALMGMPPSCPIELAAIEFEPLDIPELDVCDLEWQALTHRPELLSQDMQVCVDADEVRTSILEMYPNVSLFGGYNHDANKFLVFSNWLSIGARLSYDLLSLPSKQHRITQNRWKHWLTKETRLSMSVGVMTQVHLAYINVQETLTQFRLAKELDDVKNRMWELSIKYEEAGQFDPEDVSDHEIEALFAELNAYKAYANVHVALEQLGNTVGRSLMFTDIDLGCHLWDVRQGCDRQLYEWSWDPEPYSDIEVQAISASAEPSVDADTLLVTPRRSPEQYVNPLDPDMWTKPIGEVIDADTVLVAPHRSQKRARDPETEGPSPRIGAEGEREQLSENPDTDFAPLP